MPPVAGLVAWAVTGESYTGIKLGGAALAQWRRWIDLTRTRDGSRNLQEQIESRRAAAHSLCACYEFWMELARMRG